MALNLQIGNVANAVGIKTNPTPTASTGLIGPPAPPVSVGNQAQAPTTNVKPPVNVLPKAQVALKDLSGTYGKASNGTIYNTKTNQAFSNPADFFKDSGVNSFDNLKFADYTPSGKETIYGQQLPVTTQPYVAPVTPSYPGAPSAPSVQPPPDNTAKTTQPDPNTPYTPPNQGTTGVNQGGIIGNLINNAQNNPALDEANKQLTTDKKTLAEGTYNYNTNSGDTNLALGRTGALNTLFASKLAADQTAIQNALSGQSNTTTGLGTAGGLNAPITNPQTGGLVSPSTPSTTGQLTSGPNNISSLIGQRPSPSNPNVTEYFNTQTGQGFSSPQELADFINKQSPGANANASNVFQLLSSGALNNSGNSSLNPLSQIPSLVDSIINGSMSFSDGVSRGGTIPNFSSALTAAIKQRDPNFDFINSQASAEAKAHNITSTNTAANDAAKQLYLQKYPEAANLYQAISNVDDAGKLTVQNTQGQNINPFQFVPLNTTIADARRYFSSTGQATFDSNIINLRNLVQNLNASGGGNIPSAISENAQGLINGTLSMSALQALITAAKQEGQLRFNNALGTGLKGWNDLQSSSSPSSNNSTNNSNPQGWF